MKILPWLLALLALCAAPVAAQQKPPISGVAGPTTSNQLRSIMTDEVGIADAPLTFCTLGTAANNCVQLDASAFLPAINASLLTALNASALASGTVPAARMPALTGDVTTSVGAVATTLATVNGNVGVCGSATQSSVVTLNAKGLSTACTSTTVTPAIGSVTGLGTGVAAALALPATNTGSIQLAINPMAAPFNAACNGSTDDSAAFASAIAAGTKIVVPIGVTCIVGNLVVPAGKLFECNNSFLQAASGTNWVIKKSGVNTWIKNCWISDPNNYNRKSTTLASGASAGAATVSVASATGFANGMPVVFPLASGAYWPTKIKPVAGISGTTFTIVDPVPYSATAVAVSGGGGTNCGIGTTLVVQGGSGPPTTLLVSSASAGAVTGVTIGSPGLYSTAPSNPVTAVSGNNAACTATFTLTMGGASSGATFEGTWGSLVVDQSSYGGLENIVMSSCFGCIGYYSTSATASNWTTQEKVSGVQINASRFFGVLVDAGVYVSFFKDILMYGNTHGSSNYGTVGFWRNYVQPTNAAPSGGNHFSYTTLTFETGTLNNLGNLDFFEDGPTNDTIRNYAFICNGCYKNSWVGPAFNAFTGPNAYSGTGGGGVGTYFGKYTPQGGSVVPAVDNIMSGGHTGGSNAADIFFSDWSGDGSGTGAAVWLGPSGPNPILSGYTAAIQNATAIFSGGSGATVGGTGTTWYVAQGLGASTTETNVSTLVPRTGSITKFACVSDVAPGVGQTYTCAFRDFPTPNAGVSTTRGSCSYTGAATYGCTYTGPGFYIADQDQVALQITSSASAPAAVFKVYAAGL